LCPCFRKKQAEQKNMNDEAFDHDYLSNITGITFLTFLFTS
jgi:hypothetical protein